MATVAQMVEIVAGATMVDVDTVRQVARFVREAGYLPTSRGRSVAPAGPREAAVLLGALLAGDKVVKAGEAAEFADNIRAEKYYWSGGTASTPAAELLGEKLPPNHSLVDVLEAAIRAEMEGGLLGECPLAIECTEAIVRRPVETGTVSFWVLDTRSEVGAERMEELRITYYLPQDTTRYPLIEIDDELNQVEWRNRLNERWRKRPAMWDGRFIVAREVGSGTFKRIAHGLLAADERSKPGDSAARARSQGAGT